MKNYHNLDFLGGVSVIMHDIKTWVLLYDSLKLFPSNASKFPISTQYFTHHAVLNLNLN